MATTQLPAAHPPLLPSSWAQCSLLLCLHLLPAPLLVLPHLYLADDIRHGDEGDNDQEYDEGAADYESEIKYYNKNENEKNV